MLGCAALAAATQPNVLVVVLDDLGFGDVGYNNPEMASATPTIDRLAAAGVKLDQFYTSPTCTASRAALLTGMYPMRLGLQDSVVHSTEPRGVPLDKVLLSERMKTTGYKTALIGKWHIGFHQTSFTPTQRGFDEFFGILTGGGDHFKHESTGAFTMRGPEYKSKTYAFKGNNLWRNDKAVLETEPGIAGVHSTELYTQEAVQYVNNHVASRRAANASADGSVSVSPFFLMLSYQAVHAPVQAPDEYVDGTIQNGCNHLHAGDQTRMRRKLCGMMSQVDTGLASMVASLKMGNEWDRTAVLFMSDNGGINRHGSSNAPLRGEKGSYLEGGIRVPAFWSGGHTERMLDFHGVQPHLSKVLTHVTDIHATLLSLAGGVLPGASSTEEGAAAEAAAEDAARTSAGGEDRRALAAEYSDTLLVADRDEALDGVDQWSAYVAGGKSLRRHIAHNINSDLFGSAGALRVGEYKLIVEARVSESEIYEYGQHMLQDDDWDEKELSQVIHQKLLRSPGEQHLYNLNKNPSELNTRDCDDVEACTNLYDEPAFAEVQEMMLAKWAELEEINPDSNELWVDDGPLADPTNFGGVWTPWRDEAGVPYALYSLVDESHHDRLGGDNKPKPAVATTGAATGELAAVAEKASAAANGAAAKVAAKAPTRRLAARERAVAVVDNLSATGYAMLGAVGGAFGAAVVLRQTRV